MTTGGGDRLAKGARKASWGPLEVSEQQWKQATRSLRKKAKVFCECNDCGGVFYSAADFSAHVPVCLPVKK